MPIIKSAKKRVKVSNKAAIRNSKTKRSLKEAIKSFTKIVASNDSKKSLKALDQVQSELDKAAKKGVIHKNKAARKKAQAARNAKKATGGAAKATTTTKTKAATKPVVKAKAVAKKAPAKKPVAKKAPAKKPATKK